MKTNYKQSQAAPHAKPIFTVSRNDSTLYVLPAYLAGAVMIRLQHIADGDKVKKLSTTRILLSFIRHHLLFVALIIPQDR